MMMTMMDLVMIMVMMIFQKSVENAQPYREKPLALKLKSEHLQIRIQSINVRVPHRWDVHTK
jgi:hypothetical protein